jgi:hypothetical protein
VSPEHFGAIFQELLDENPFAVRATLRILQTEFTPSVPTLAVTCEPQPRLLVNLEFVSQHCRTEAHVKALLCHEFLHVLLRHTEQSTPITQARHIATDAVINAIIHRTLGACYSSLMADYYAVAEGVQRLLRPPRAGELLVVRSLEAPAVSLKNSLANSLVDSQFVGVWRGLYAGTLNVDDIEAVAKEVMQSGKATTRLDGASLLGNHDSTEPLPEALVDALNRSLREMNGQGIWRNPKSHGVGANPYQALMRASDDPVRAWEAATLQVLRKHVVPDRKARTFEDEEAVYRVPVLSATDRRAFLGALWLPYLPEANWAGNRQVPRGTTQVYLDVSGSMHAEMPHIVSLLGRLQTHIRKPLWAFSDEVAPAVIRSGRLITSTSGGTSMTCVLEHLSSTRPDAAVIVTDGFIETVAQPLLRKVQGTRIHALLSRNGSAVKLKKAGIPYTQLGRLTT